MYSDLWLAKATTTYEADWRETKMHKALFAAALIQDKMAEIVQSG